MVPESRGDNREQMIGRHLVGKTQQCFLQRGRIPNGTAVKVGLKYLVSGQNDEMGAVALTGQA